MESCAFDGDSGSQLVLTQSLGCRSSRPSGRAASSGRALRPNRPNRRMRLGCWGSGKFGTPWLRMRGSSSFRGLGSRSVSVDLEVGHSQPFVIGDVPREVTAAASDLASGKVGVRALNEHREAPGITPGSHPGQISRPSGSGNRKKARHSLVFRLCRHRLRDSACASWGAIPLRRPLPTRNGATTRAAGRAPPRERAGGGDRSR